MAQDLATQLVDVNANVLGSSDLLSKIHQIGAVLPLAVVTASGSTTVNFDNYLTSTFDNYMITIEGVVPGTNGEAFSLQLGTGSTPTYQTSGYTGALGVTKAASRTSVSSGTASISMSDSGVLNNTAARGSTFILTLSNMNSAVTDKIVTGYGNYWGSEDVFAELAARWQNTAIVTSIKFFMTTGTISTGVFRLYGIPN